MAEDKRPVNDWTVMFFFAGDNALSPLIVSQVRAIKEAGFQKNTDVLIHFDPNELGAPTRIFHVNRKRKKDDPKRPTEIGDGVSSNFRNTKDDIVPLEEVLAHADAEVVAAAAGNGNGNSFDLDKVKVLDALNIFLNYCRTKHPAKNYLLFLVGHGLIVGNDAFLPDEHPDSAITLEQLDTAIRDGFTELIAKDEPAGTLQLIALHSCGMSAIEVAYQLKGTAKFMMGSEGISYVGSWPYRQMLKSIFTTVELTNGDGKSSPQRLGKVDFADFDDFKDPFYVEGDPSELDVERLVEKLYFLSLFCATDYMLTGYSLDLSLCSLDEDLYKPLTSSIRTLVKELKRALSTRHGKELILLAHWESQSYWDEMYTDLYDFCFCLKRRCRSRLDELKKLGRLPLAALGKNVGSDKLATVKKLQNAVKELTALKNACGGVIKLLATNPVPTTLPTTTPSAKKISEDLSNRFSKVVVHSEQFGPLYQYSRGLSIYFPWARPVDDDPLPDLPVPRQPERQEDTNEPRTDVSANTTGDTGILANYCRYKFTTALGGKCAEPGQPAELGDSWLSFLEAYFEATQRRTRKEETTTTKKKKKGTQDDSMRDFSNFFNPSGPLRRMPASALTGGGGKPSPSTGPSPCSCPSIKNYPTEELIVRGKVQTGQAVTATDGMSSAF